LRRLRSSTVSGRHSRCLCGPGDGLGANTPPSLSSIQWLGALSRFRCFLGPRGMVATCGDVTTRVSSPNTLLYGCCHGICCFRPRPALRWWPPPLRPQQRLPARPSLDHPDPPVTCCVTRRGAKERMRPWLANGQCVQTMHNHPKQGSQPRPGSGPPLASCMRLLQVADDLATRPQLALTTELCPQQSPCFSCKLPQHLVPFGPATRPAWPCNTARCLLHVHIQQARRSPLRLTSARPLSTPSAILAATGNEPGAGRLRPTCVPPLQLLQAPAGLACTKEAATCAGERQLRRRRD